MGGWDIMPRIISGGIWRPCRIVQRRPDRIDDLCVYVQNINIKDGWAGLTFFYNLTVAEDEIRDYSLIIDGSCGDSKFHAETKRLLHTAGKLGAHVGGAKFWWPRNYGDPNLYDIRATLCYLGKPVYEYSLKYGIRSIRLERTSTTDVSGNGEFCFYINDKKIFWLGSNWGAGRRAPFARPLATAGDTSDALRHRLQQHTLLGAATSTRTTTSTISATQTVS